MGLSMNNGVLRVEYVAIESWQFRGPEVEGINLKGKRLTNPTYHFVADFAEVGG